jgi:hypothetical protein
MPRANIFQWREGAGWLILSGGGENPLAVGDIETLALGKALPGEAMAYVFAAGDIETADRHLAALEDAGAPTGYLVDVQTEDDNTVRAQLSEAGLIIIGDGDNPGALRGGLAGAALDGITQAYERGVTVLAIGTAAVVFGQRYAGGTPAAIIRDGLAWLDHGLIVPHYVVERDADRMRGLLLQTPDLYALTLGVDSALALGNDGTVELWGERAVGVTLGAQYVPMRPPPDQASP